jgi:hypothetical protein
MSALRTYRAGESIEDFCRACKTDRTHTVIAADAGGRPVRVACDYCESQHNYRGGPRIAISGSQPSAPAPARGSAVDHVRPRPPGASSAAHAPPYQPAPARAEPLPIVSDRERTAPPMPLPDHSEDLEVLLRRIIREEAGLTPVTPAPKWRGGTLVLRPGSPGLQEKSWPIETFFHKVVMLRNRLRTLEQQLNASDLSDDVKVKLQGYVSGCYGSLTSFNILFADEEDQFKGNASA